MRELRASFDYVLVNAPPATRDSVQVFSVSLADGVVLIVEAKLQLTASQHREIKEEIEAAGDE